MVRVWVGEKGSQGRFSGYWAEFEGEEIRSYETEGVVYTLYKCTRYNFPAYRVHISYETDPQAPVYKLHPYSEDPHIRPSMREYPPPYTKEGIAEKYPIFLRNVDHSQPLPVDPL